MSGTRLLARIAAAALGTIAFAAGCNAIVGNGDIDFATDGGAPDATTAPEASAESGPTQETQDAGYDAPEAIDDASPEASPPDAACEAGTKLCAGACRGFEDPGYGCGPTHCSPCEVANAFAGCAAIDAGVDGGAHVGTDGGADSGTNGDVLACSVAACMGIHADCNGTPLDGCETDTSSDLYNCGTCGNDCTKLPNVAGNVTCTGGICTFDSSACAPGYGICTTNPENGCDTNISVPAHCGGCATTCTTGFYCSTTGANAFTCTSVCGTGLSLCGASCVNEQTDPTHCGGCATQCPAVTGGTATCSAGGVCGFTCNASDHRCGTGSGATCAANNDPNNCGSGAACGKCTAPANATPTCTGGTTCGYVCNPGAHACPGSVCVLNSDPDNCGTACNTNCSGPTQGSGAASCDGNNCAVTCSGGETLCNTTQCVNEQTDSNNCGGCGSACGPGQVCSGGSCVCASSCPGGCCDSSGACHSTSTSASCGTLGASCVASCPLTIPESTNLVLWLVGDTYAGASPWVDQSGHASATCSACPSPVAGALNGHGVVAFNGSSYFQLGDPGGLYNTTAFTIFVVAAPDPGASTAVSNAQLIAFSDATGNSLDLQQNGTAQDLLLQLLPGTSGANSLVATGDWASPPAFELVAAGVNATPSAFLAVDGATVMSGAIGAPASVDYASSYLGTDPATQTLDYTGQIAEVLVFNTTLSAASVSTVQAYLTTRYALP